jgi:hypothetical protein
MSLPLASTISASDTTLTVLGTIQNSSGPGVLTVESEQIAYTGNSEDQFLGCTRGYNGTSAVSHAANKAVTLNGLIVPAVQETAATAITETYVDSHSHQSDAADLTLDSKAGSSTSGSPKYLASSMWNVFGDTLTRTANYIAGVIGAYSVTGTKSSTYPTGAVLAQITDGVTDVDGAVVAYIDGDSSQTNAGAAFTVRNNNSTPGSGFAFGVDLKGPTHDGYPAVAFIDGEMRFSNGTYVTVSGNTIVFHNSGNTATATITMS